MALAIEVFRCGPLDNGVYVLYDQDLAMATVVDPSFDSDRAWDFVARRGFQLEAIVNTHGHFDHVVGNAAWRDRAPDAPLYLHPADTSLLAEAPAYAELFGLHIPSSPPANRAFIAGQQEIFAGVSWRVLHIPGHSPGSVCLYYPGTLIGGDVLFRGSIGRTDLPGGDHDVLVEGIHRQVLTLPDETTVYPGHGAPTTIGWERTHNPFLR